MATLAVTGTPAVLQGGPDPPERRLGSAPRPIRTFRARLARGAIVWIAPSFPKDVAISTPQEITTMGPALVVVAAAEVVREVVEASGERVPRLATVMVPTMSQRSVGFAVSFAKTIPARNSARRPSPTPSRILPSNRGEVGEVVA